MGFISKLYDKKISSKGIGVFRIFFSFILLLDVIWLFRFRQLYFDPIPFIERNLLGSEIAFALWICTLLFLITGAYTRIAALINYIFVLIFISHIGSFEYHMYYIYTSVCFLLVFLPISKSFSIDALLKKLKYSNLNSTYIPKQTTSVLNYWLIVFFGIALVYLDSVYQKSDSQTWLNGLGLWLPSSIPQMTIWDNQWLLNQEFLMKFLGYLTLVFELVFPFLFWVKKLRIPLFIIGIGLHIGILLEFPIPNFAFGVMSIYLLMIPVCFWDKIQAKLKSKTVGLTLYYDEECPLCMRTKIVLSHFDVFGKLDFKSLQQHASSNDVIKGIPLDDLLNNIHSIDKNNTLFKGLKTYKKAFLLVPILFPLGLLISIPGISFIANKIYRFIALNRTVDRCNEDNCGFLPAPKNIDNDEVRISQNFKIKNVKIIGLQVFVVTIILLQTLTNFKKLFNDELTSKALTTLNKVSSKFLGITQHGVFLDGHYTGYDKLYSLTYNGEMLPLFDEKGMPDGYVVAGVWADFGFRVNRPYVLDHLDDLKAGLIRYSAFWAHKNNVDLSKAEFKIIKKNISASFTWKKNLLHKNTKAPWKEVGKVTWKDKEALVSIKTND